MPSGLGIESFHLGIFVVIAEPAGQPEIFLVVRAALCLGHDVFDLQPTQHESLGSQAITTTIPGLGSHTPADFLLHATPAQGCKGGRNLRRADSRSAWAFRKSWV